MNLIFGLSQMFMSLSYLFVIVPKMKSLYEQFAARVDLTESYLILFAVLIVGILNIITTIKLFTKDGIKLERYFRFGLILIFTSLLGFTIYYQVALASVVNPIYSLY
ncbi:hypothetical protein A3D84_03920 [Candidatus Woesebacteria bacterium RIFCSPHIGHO2_02_FULL_42_20]|nr:MAG: hypothetical protein A2W15_04075 [Candidatus Woesebacteria bacterium RBG_16_41_13]OGM29118.1 MAG: hypothetical protein A2873_00090 [Candidatus Woesebacteria bacterium RIFCSPHIGHO2_01_FULL_42_80]OGM35679.1 MAG: hypothetical protein A3D84_03920 [Candidatus Woesebacteria bacterium RIFCSPHIGHO2_02_FULL_42_20]OGM66796.1 MAG: hypothetical protein A2969_00090 [Candidatus Woesebacteria bacterium RIFCSPLOWO2_01_FULL_42_67]OGM71529.1 MAG: hypothetical protein A3I55_01875 [Candidatus Woesebacteria